MKGMGQGATGGVSLLWVMKVFRRSKVGSTPPALKRYSAYGTDAAPHRADKTEGV